MCIDVDTESHETPTKPILIIPDDLPLLQDDFYWADEAEKLEQQVLLQRSNMDKPLACSTPQDKGFLNQDDFDWADEAEELEYAALRQSHQAPALPNRAGGSRL